MGGSHRAGKEEREKRKRRLEPDDGGRGLKTSNLSARKREGDEDLFQKGRGTEGFSTNLAIQADLICMR